MKIVHLGITDLDWLQTMIDLEDLHFYNTLIYNVRLRPHLLPEKRALGLQQLAWIN